MRSRIWIAVDSAMLLSIIVLQVWRLTGVPLHEWLAVGLIAAITAHLLAHWNWIETRARRMLQSGTARTRVNFTLNAALFIAMSIAMVSGFMISKVVLPAHPSPDDYLKWHGLHETSSRLLLAIVGLHLALNWDVMFGGRPRIRAWVRPIGAMAVAVALVTGATYAVEHAMSRPDITMIRDGKRIEHARPPRDIANLRRDQLRPNPRYAAPLIPIGIAIAVSALVGRKVLRLRLD